MTDPKDDPFPQTRRGPAIPDPARREAVRQGGVQHEQAERVESDLIEADHISADLGPEPLHPTSIQPTKDGASTFSNMRIITEDEQHKAFRSAQRHTRRVTWLKWLLPLIALGIIGSFTTWAVNQKTVPLPEEVVSNEEAFKQDEIIMQNPNLNGFSDDRAYEVKAVKAIQKLSEPDVVNLEDLSARITMPNADWVTFTSNAGRFNQKDEFLELSGAVDVKSSQGYGLKTEAVEVKMKDNYLRTTEPVRIASKDILLQADTLEAIDSGDLIRFTGNVRLRIDTALINGESSAAPQQGSN
ncbi:LPS export ABC transporter periplasmic protein LptC [Cohaesibacter sp. CAU 1516]|uniref:LPS export ABC transporter periplasmic protein LptC n=1 Tax=Cohaesibacter sp. CAU 1516 TaxID=2576038 RepID=UPI0010FEFED0|nr:LPS export ABC transporter periplasmic protein LptC [Cohaesibacter sp. CAU 1516]TLP46039.1 LPS export ABC transporter periplasmic protein LptC [Cohaesibacter sp. CAU 1516]